MWVTCVLYFEIFMCMWVCGYLKNTSTIAGGGNMTRLQYGGTMACT